MLLNSLITQLNKLRYYSRSSVIFLTRLITLISSVVTFLLLIYAAGFEPEEYIKEGINLAIDITFSVYVLIFFIRWFYALQRTDFLKYYAFEGLLVLAVLINGVSRLIFDTNLLEILYEASHTSSAYPTFFEWVAGITLAIYWTYKVAKTDVLSLPNLSLKPSVVLIVSFAVLAMTGVLLLMLPAMTVGDETMPFLDALFTAMSATCVAGLSVVDISSYFTFKGHIVILLLIQLGGIGIVIFAAFFAAFLSKGLGIRQQLMVKNFLNSETLSSTKALLKQVIVITLIIEATGFVCMFCSWGDAIVFQSLGEKVFYSLFHTISAFCNAGFSLFPAGFYTPVVKSLYGLHMVIAIVSILGGIGFPTIEDVFSPRAMLERRRSPWKRWKLDTKIAIYTSLVLLVFGTVMLFLLERNNTLHDLGFVEATITSFFQASNARSAGYNTVNMQELRVPSLYILIFLMFIGASSGSIGGGIKTSTFCLIIASIIATLGGRSKIEVEHRFIPKELLFKTLSIFVSAVAFNLLGLFLLTITEPAIDFIDLAFEQVSAFGVVGLSTGITKSLTPASRIIIITAMFIGRVGPLTLAYALSKYTTHAYRYPKAYVMIG